MTRIFAIVAATALALLLAGLFIATLLPRGGDRFAQCRGGQVAAGGDVIGGPFTLISETGDEVTDAQVIDEPALIYFGYTYCPDVCPLDLARNVEAVQTLESRGYRVKPVFISIDPERDTPDHLAEYTDYMHPRLLGLTGSDAQVSAASQAYRAYSRKQPGEADAYLVDHSTFTYLTLPEAGFVDFFRRDATADAMAERVACVLDAA